MTLAEADFARAAEALRCPVAAVKAVCEVEAPEGGFDAAGRPRILFEGHKFSAATGGRYDKAYPTLSYPVWTRQFYARGADANARNAGEHQRLQQAARLDRNAALASASWGKFQILGENFRACGFTTLQAFINAMYSSEGRQLEAFVAFVKHEGLADEMRDLRWADFARRYNGPRYAENSYDVKLAAAYGRHAC
ncbi:N-acetylmuramidase family protein [Variovorax sp. YR216]|uniref:N-acetylmuramidase family protein n=1 Tax=Variovorax sp. YR216 TaxID=1882828 RepID=UPI00089A2211|nr:N-acetylmuramidase family protein [Variovorax sp. YR216]SEA50729.1 Protein of unknown function [Variovorax sp. YR216]